MKNFHYRYLDKAGECLAEQTIQSNFASSHAFFCNVCGDVWARIHCDDPVTTWQVYANPCLEHNPTGAYDWHCTPGSILSAYTVKALVTMPQWARALEYLPDAILKLEFDAHLKHYYKILGESYEQSTIDSETSNQSEPIAEYTGAGNNRSESGTASETNC